MLKGHVFSKQIFGNTIFALFINTFLNGKNGVSNNYKSGMAVTYSGSTLTVQSGAVCIQGRFLEEDTSTDIVAGTDTAYCKLVLEIDLSKENTESEFNQASYKIVKSTSGYPTLTQNDIVKNNVGVYQYELARFKTGTNGITDFQDMRTFLDFESIYDAIQTEYRSILSKLENELSNVENGSAYMLKNQFVTLYGTIEMPEANSGSLNGSLIFNYPEGFTKDNCVVISLMSHNTVNEDRWSTPISSQHSSVALLGNGDTEVILETDNIRIMSFKVDDTQPRNDVSFRITLMKLPVPEYTLGDVNDDGVIDEADYEIVKDYIMGNRVLTDKEFKAADMNNDYKINSGDTFLLIEKINGIE